MGWWKFEAWKEDSKEHDVELDDADLEHIAEAIKEGYTSGEVADSETCECRKRKAEEAKESAKYEYDEEGNLHLKQGLKA